MADTRGMPSMLALLGLLAVAGFQNRDKIADALKGVGGAPANPAGGEPDDERRHRRHSRGAGRAPRRTFRPIGRRALPAMC